MTSLFVASPSLHHAADATRKISSNVYASLQKAVSGLALGEFFNWLAEGHEAAEARKREAYLAESSDIYELEFRMRKLDQEKPAKPYWMTGY